MMKTTSPFSPHTHTHVSLSLFLFLWIANVTAYTHTHYDTNIQLIYWDRPNFSSTPNSTPPTAPFRNLVEDRSKFARKLRIRLHTSDGYITRCTHFGGVPSRKEKTLHPRTRPSRTSSKKAPLLRLHVIINFVVLVFTTTSHCCGRDFHYTTRHKKIPPSTAAPASLVTHSTLHGCSGAGWNQFRVSPSDVVASSVFLLASCRRT